MLVSFCESIAQKWQYIAHLDGRVWCFSISRPVGRIQKPDVSRMEENHGPYGPPHTHTHATWQPLCRWGATKDYLREALQFFCVEWLVLDLYVATLRPLLLDTNSLLGGHSHLAAPLG